MKDKSSFLMIGEHIINLNQYKVVSVKDNKVKLEDLDSNHYDLDVSKPSESVIATRFSSGKNATIVWSVLHSSTP